MMLIYTPQDIIGLVLILGAAAIATIVGIARYFKQSRCKHNQVTETRACDAICASCGKNLGFIGTWRQRND